MPQFAEVSKYYDSILDHIQQSLCPVFSHFQTNLGWTVAWHSSQGSLVVLI